ncbi:hypothetical protein D7V83_10845 [bacterium 0.1xD8-71]|nr:hypothetical protein D7V83_10845 [bacterium 0.1xD8-71]
MESGIKRPCRRCLTRDMDQKEYFENLHAYIANLEEEVKVNEPLYERRLLVCKSCDLLYDGMCRACGCYVELRAVIKKNSCPYDKWMAVPVSDCSE